LHHYTPYIISKQYIFIIKKLFDLTFVDKQFSVGLKQPKNTYPSPASPQFIDYV